MMNAKLREKLRVWVEQAILELKAKGATEADMEEKAFADFVGEKVAASYSEEGSPDEELREAVMKEWLTIASPDDLREMAQIARDKHWSNMAYDLEWLADRRQRGEETED